MKKFFTLFKCCTRKKDDSDEKDIKGIQQKESITSKNRSKDVLSDYKIDVDIDENIRKSKLIK
jgi:hypothetical protein